MPRISLRLVVGFSQVVILIMNGAHHSNWASVILEGIAVPLELFGGYGNRHAQKWQTVLIVCERLYSRCNLSLAISNAFNECLVIVERCWESDSACHILPRRCHAYLRCLPDWRLCGCSTGGQLMRCSADVTDWPPFQQIWHLRLEDFGMSMDVSFSISDVTMYWSRT